MNTRKIVVCRFSKGRLGEEIAQILGSLIISMVSISALKREKQKARPPFMLIADEVHNFVHGGRFGTLLAESRKYGITLVLASQGMYQLPFAKDVFSNCPTQITFNVSGDDAKAIEENWNEEQVQATHVTSLPRYSFYCRTFIDDLPHARRVVGWPSVQIDCGIDQHAVPKVLCRDGRCHSPFGTSKLEDPSQIVSKGHRTSGS